MTSNRNDPRAAILNLLLYNKKIIIMSPLLVDGNILIFLI